MTQYEPSQQWRHLHSSHEQRATRSASEQQGIPSTCHPSVYAAKVTPSIHSLLLVRVYRRYKLPGQVLKRPSHNICIRLRQERSWCNAILIRCDASALRPSWPWLLSLLSMLSLNTQLQGRPRPLLSLLRRHTPRPTSGRPIPRVQLAAARLRRMEGTAEVYTAMISARTGRCSVITTGRGRLGTTIRPGQSKFLGSL